MTHEMAKHNKGYDFDNSGWFYLDTLSTDRDIQPRADPSSSGAPRGTGHHKLSRVEKVVKWTFVGLSWIGLLIITLGVSEWI